MKTIKKFTERFMNNRNLRCAVILFVCVAAMTVAIMPVHASDYEFVCEHTSVYDEVISESTCAENGTTYQRCETCDEIITIVKDEKLPHEMSEFTITTPAGPNANGEQQSVCAKCGYVESKEYVCPHSYSYMETVKQVDCENDGKIDTICCDCSTVLDVTVVPAYGHDMGEWEVIDWALPDKTGEKAATCNTCGKYVTEKYELEMGYNWIYVPGTHWDMPFTATYLSQGTVDCNDMVADWNYWGSRGLWILGHKYGSMRYLNEIRVGDIIYMNYKGELKMYKVRVSEMGWQNAEQTCITTSTSGHTIFDTFERETLHIYTCYNSGNCRWVVLGELIN